MEIKKSVSDKRSFRPVFWGVVLILTAVVLILDGVGVRFGVGITPLRIVAGVLLASWLIYEVIKLKFTDVFFPIAFLFLLFEEPIARALGRENGSLISGWVVLLSALLLTIGFKAIFKPKRTVSVNGRDYTVPNGSTGKLGQQTLYFDAADLSDANVRENLGTVEVFITNRDQYNGGGVITVTENLGKVTVHLPSEWNVVTKSSENLGNVDIPPHDAAGSQSITLVITENMGSVRVLFD